MKIADCHSLFVHKFLVDGNGTCKVVKRLGNSIFFRVDRGNITQCTRHTLFITYFFSQFQTFGVIINGRIALPHPFPYKPEIVVSNGNSLQIVFLLLNFQSLTVILKSFFQISLLAVDITNIAKHGGFLLRCTLFSDQLK